MAEVILKNIGKAYDNGYEAVKNVNILSVLQPTIIL